jgi:CHAT domain-containing protein
MARSPRLLRAPTSTQRAGDDGKLRVLLVADPSGDLEGATHECNQVGRILEEGPLADRLTVELVDASTDSFTLRSKMRRCHILHFAGHGVYAARPGDLSQTGWLVRGRMDALESADVLRASALDGFWTDAAPRLVFANACDSGRGNHEAAHRRPHSDAAIGLAQAFLAAGVDSYVGTIWQAPDDETTIAFARTFYEELVAGRTVSQALMMARNKSAAQFGDEDLTWARYVLFGDPLTQLSAGSPA